MIARKITALFLWGVCLLAGNLHAQQSNIRLGDLQAYTLADVAEDAVAKEFSSLLGQEKAKEALAAAEAAAAKDEAIGHFLLGFSAENGKGAEADFAKAEKHYRDGAKKEHVPSIVNLAALLLRQNSSNEEAAKLLRGVQEKDPKTAGFFLGIACLTGATGTPDFQSAAQMWTRAAEVGNSSANRYLGFLYQGLFGFPAQADLKKSAEFFQKAADAGDAESSIRLGLLILEAGEKIGRKNTEATSWFEKAASTNNPAALFLLGQVREQGTKGVVDADPKAARELYGKAAAQDHGPALVRLGYLTERGLGGDADLEEAIKLYRKAAELGEASAYFNLGVLTQKGEGGLEKSDSEAFRLFLQSALRGFAPGANLVGTAYRAGLGVSPDIIAAAAWFSRAAEAGETNAMVSLAEMMLSNQGIPFNAELLGQLTQRAFSAGNPRAGLLLGRMAERGVGLEKNLGQALAFYRWAGKRDLEDAKTAAAEVEKLMSKEEVAAADALTKQLEEQPKPAEAPKDDEGNKKPTP
jgi:TPR repeat protein